MKLYRICTEDRNSNVIRRMVIGSGFEGCTLIHGEGYFKGKWEAYQEKSLVVEIVAPKEDYGRVLNLAVAIRSFNHQECVMVQSIDIDSDMV